MILISYGTRPEWIKIKPLVKYYKHKGDDIKVLFTGQHNTLVDEYYDEKLSIKNSTGNRLNDIYISILSQIDFKDIDTVIVQGDTSSACAIALAAFHFNLRVVHLEAGLRTYDKYSPYPEEINRQIISRIADIHLCPTTNNYNDLKNEKLNEHAKLFVVGNTVLDNFNDIQTSYGNIILITLHRRENIPIMKLWFEQINRIAKKHKHLNFLFPIHPNPKIREHKHILSDVNVVEPMSHESLINYMSQCRLVISDSGGLQEEAAFLNKKIIVARNNTERQESLGVHSFLCESPNNLIELFEKHIKDYEVNAPCPYGDGKSSEKIYEILKK